MSNGKLAIILHIITLISLIIVAAIGLISSIEAEKTQKYIAKNSYINNKIDQKIDVFLHNITLGLHKNSADNLQKNQALTTKLQQYQNDAILATQIFFTTLAIYLICYWCFFNNIENQQFFIINLLTISFLLLIVGLIAPILSIVTYKEIPMLGNVILKFQSKGIATTIIKLFESQNFIVGILLALFSILIPFIKTTFMAYIVISQQYSKEKYLKIICNIGKWSMADIFVIALLLTYFSVDYQEFTDAKLQIGLYFFSGYAILSMGITHLINNSLKDYKASFK